MSKDPPTRWRALKQSLRKALCNPRTWLILVYVLRLVYWVAKLVDALMTPK
jgi:hypothetical protein